MAWQTTSATPIAPGTLEAEVTHSDDEGTTYPVVAMLVQHEDGYDGVPNRVVYAVIDRDGDIVPVQDTRDAAFWQIVDAQSEHVVCPRRIQ